MTISNSSYIETTTFDIVAATIGYVTSVFIFFGNGLVIAAIVKFPQLKCPTNWLVFNLSLADVVVGFFLPFLSTVYIRSDLKVLKSACFLRYFVCMLGASVSIMTLTVITVDRVVAITSPLRYPQLITDRRVLIASIVVWLYSLILCIMPTAGWNTWHGICVFQKIMPPEYVIFISANFTALVIAIVAMYIKIFHVAKKQMSQIAALSPKTNSAGDDSQPKHKHSLGLSKATKMVTLVLGVFLVSWAPFFLIIVTQAILTMKEGDDYYYPGLDNAELLTGIFGLANSMWNPLIYSWKNKDFKLAFGKILHCGNKIEQEPETRFTSGLD